MGKRKRYSLAIFFIMVFLTGCGLKGEENAVKETAQESSTQNPAQSSAGEGAESDSGEEGAEPSPTQEKPEAVPNISVNRLGYITKGDKAAIFYGKELPQEFHVVRAESGEVVFAGYLRDNGYNETGQEYNGYGDFSEVQESGTYYIEAPLLGKSHPFRIGDDLYQKVLEEACKGSVPWQQGEEADSFPEKAGDLALLLLAYELNSGIFTDDTGIPESGNKVPDLLDEIRQEAEGMLKMQDPETGAVNREDDGEEAWEEAFAAVLAKFSYLYQSYDTDFATECLKAADRAWMCAASRTEQRAESGQQAKFGQENGWKLTAAAELYRASGKQSFYDNISAYFEDDGILDDMNLPVLLGCVTYISTRQPVDIALCREITRALTDRADEAAERAQEVFRESRKDESGGNFREILENSIYLIVINHMITSREYEVAIEDILHCLMGRNRQSIKYYEQSGRDLEAAEQLEGGRLVLLLSEILNWQKEHEDVSK